MASTTRTRLKKFLGYPAFFFILFVVSLYVTFPMEALRPRVMQALEQAVGSMGPKAGRYGTPAEVKVKDIGLYRLSGLDLGDVDVRLATSDPEPGPMWHLDRARVRVALLPLLLGDRVVKFDLDVYGGNVVGSALLVEDRLVELDVDVDAVRLGDVKMIADTLGTPLVAPVSAQVAMKMGKLPKETAGTILMQSAGVTIKPGTLRLPLPGIPINCNLKTAIDLGTLDVSLKFDDGKLSTERARLVGKDIDFKADLSLNMRGSLKSSPVKGAMKIKFDEGLLKREKEVESAVQLAELKIKRGKDKEGAYRFKLQGTLGTLRPVADATVKID